MAESTGDCSELPLLVAVMGTTGTGKSDLANHLAEALHGEVINVDALQVYKGLDILTNKLPLTAHRAPHHLMNFRDIENHATPYDVREFERDASQLVRGGGGPVVQTNS
jgi:tRNA dimethylallyltransferase